MNDMLAFARNVVPTSDCCSIPGTGHHAGATTEDIIAAGRDRIVHVHFNDSPNLASRADPTIISVCYPAKVSST